MKSLHFPLTHNLTALYTKQAQNSLPAKYSMKSLDIMVNAVLD